MEEKEIVRFVKPLYGYKDSMHDFKHILRIKKRVNLYRKDYKKIDEQKLMFLIYFHGLKKFVEEHEVEVIAQGFPKKWILALYRHTKNPKSIEEKLVSDANLWEAVGKFGIKKSLQVGRERGRSREETLAFMKKHISKVKFYTRSGKKFGNSGIKIIKDFLKK
jgi:hypothetical protein